MARPFVILSLTLALYGCGNHDGEKSLLQWRDTVAGVDFEVFQKPTLAKTNSYIRVGDKSTLIDDDAIFSMPRLLRIDNWLLVLNENDVWGGYNYDSKRLYGEYDWEELPFTVYSSGGTIVAEKRHRPKSESARPIAWPLREQPSG